jgi:hypothetical protein
MERAENCVVFDIKAVKSNALTKVLFSYFNTNLPQQIHFYLLLKVNVKVFHTLN